MRFVVDAMLGKLAKWLRILGYDTLYYRELGDRELIRIAEEEGRILLTSDRELLKHRQGNRRFLISSDLWQEQLCEVAESLEINLENIFTRCIECNSRLENVDRETVRDKVPPYVYETQWEFGKCPACGKVYWKGTHFENARMLAEKVIKRG